MTDRPPLTLERGGAAPVAGARQVRIGDRVRYSGGEPLTVAKVFPVTVSEVPGANPTRSWTAAQLVTAKGSVRIPAFDVARLAWSPDDDCWLVVVHTGTGGYGR